MWKKNSKLGKHLEQCWAHSKPLRSAVFTRGSESSRPGCPLRSHVPPLLPGGDLSLMLPGVLLSSLQAPFSPPVTPGLSSYSAHHIPGTTGYLQPLEGDGLDIPFHVPHHLQSQKLNNGENNRHCPSRCADNSYSAFTHLVRAGHRATCFYKR